MQSITPNVGEGKACCTILIEMSDDSLRAITALQNSEKLMQAVFQRNLAECTRLLDAGADVNYANQSGYTPLHDAVAGRAREIVTLLLSWGAIVNVVDKNGITPLNLAQGRVSGLAPDPVITSMLLEQLNRKEPAKQSPTQLSESSDKVPWWKFWK